MKKLIRKLEETMANAALLEMGVDVYMPRTPRQKFSEAVEEHFVEIAFAEAAAYDEIHKVILQEHREKERVHIDECRYGDNDACFVH